MSNTDLYVNLREGPEGYTLTVETLKGTDVIASEAIKENMRVVVLEILEGQKISSVLDHHQATELFRSHIVREIWGFADGH